jgi:flagellar biosynthesis protein FlhB
VGSFFDLTPEERAGLMALIEGAKAKLDAEAHFFYFEGMQIHLLILTFLLSCVTLHAGPATEKVAFESDTRCMTKEEVKDESKQSEGNPHVKGEMRKRQMRRKSLKAQLDDLPNADVVIANPTHIAVALRYDRDTMAAPRIIAMAKDYNALRIRELAEKLQIPVLENKPLARMLLKYGKVDADIPIQLYTAVAEILAYVYRVNRFRYYARSHAASAKVLAKRAAL